MEETKETKLSYEQLEQIALQLKQRVAIAETKLNSLDFATMRLTWLFKVIENSSAFSTYFTTKAAKEIENLLTLEEETEAETDKA